MNVDIPAKKRERTTLSGSDNRWYGPDYARGAMLLLIAVANAPYWLPAATTTPEVLAEGGVSSDSLWVFIRSMLIDQREFPLFSLLIGFGCAIAVVRLSAREESLVDTIRAMRLRGVWMMVFGAVHALVFQGDVLGAYGLALVLFAGVIARTSLSERLFTREVLVWIGVSLIPAAMILWYGGSVGADGSGIVVDWAAYGALSPAYSLLYWALNTPGLLLGTTIVPSILLGTALARSTWLTEPQEARRQLLLVGLVLTLVSATGALLHAVHRVGGLDEPSWALLLHVFTGTLGATGLLALLVLVSSFPGLWFRDGIIALGQRSLTWYVAQTVVFGLLYALAHSLGIWEGLTPVVGLGVGIALFGVSVAGASYMARKGYPGPLDELLRRCVKRSLVRSV